MVYVLYLLFIFYVLWECLIIRCENDIFIKYFEWEVCIFIYMKLWMVLNIWFYLYLLIINVIVILNGDKCIILIFGFELI